MTPTAAVGYARRSRRRPRNSRSARRHTHSSRVRPVGSHVTRSGHTSPCAASGRAGDGPRGCGCRWLPGRAGGSAVTGREPPPLPPSSPRESPRARRRRAWRAAAVGTPLARGPPSVVGGARVGRRRRLNARRRHRHHHCRRLHHRKVRAAVDAEHGPAGRAVCDRHVHAR